jgi:hypothetical protein
MGSHTTENQLGSILVTRQVSGKSKGDYKGVCEGEEEGKYYECIVLSHIKSRVVFDSWFGSYQKYGTYLAISHTNIEIPMK